MILSGDGLTGTTLSRRLLPRRIYFHVRLVIVGVFFVFAVKTPSRPYIHDGVVVSSGPCSVNLHSSRGAHPIPLIVPCQPSPTRLLSFLGFPRRARIVGGLEGEVAVRLIATGGCCLYVPGEQASRPG